MLPLISVLAENTLLQTAYHFLLLLVGFDTLTYRKDHDRSPILVGHQRPNDGSQEPDDTTEDYCYPEGAYYYVTAADDLE